MARTLKTVLAVILMAAGLATATGNLWVAEHANLQHELDAVRARYLLPPIPEDPALTDLASEHSWAMARAGTIWHSDNLDQTPGAWQVAGQNVGAGHSIGSVMRAFYDSPTHRDLLLEDWTAVGLGHIRDDTRVYVTLWFRK